MKNDPVLNRIWEARHSISMQCEHDPKKLVAYYLQRQKSHQKQLFGNNVGKDVASVGCVTRTR
ncbi:hypothetical protein PN36_24315 [Candidatus Thiomargarita nelsonii]|uniref:Uncharacterized protein n=1 Tax=Candidatus Thiomargarita nelsonii TaxID=1003181 RepID=A0A0A6PD39_9GAMM|nr:hypothetical protein PN36_24315 [Candidatus Thiomargarita nelsonii]